MHARALLLILSFVAVGSAAARDTIRVGAWNIEHLGSPADRDYPQHRRSAGHGSARNPGRLAEQFLAMNADVIALSEINDSDGDAQVRNNLVLDETLRDLSQRRGHRWRSALFAKRRRGDATQYTGLAWNEERVRAVGRAFRIPISDVTTSKFAEWDRSPHAMQFSRGPGRTDFVVVPIHMKAGRHESNVEQRAAEARSLIAEMAEVRAHFDDEDIILIGDFNFRRKPQRDEPAGKWIRDHGFWDLNYEDRGTHISGWPLDRAYIPRSQRDREFESARTIEIRLPPDRQAFRRAFSDHWPIVVEFAERADDD